MDDTELARSPANRVLREQASDRGQARNWLLGLPDDVRAVVWESHAIPTDAAAELQALDGSAFVKARVQKLTELEQQFMLERHVVPSSSDAPAAVAADADIETDDDA
ncbi:MAG: hypothetical protein ACR2NV_04145 [Thermoleophilaceae bacterium]